MVADDSTENLLFISYASADSEIVDELVKDLDSVRFDPQFEIFRDSTSIGAGAKWDPSINEALNRCNLALLVVTVNFWNSEFIRTKELPRLHERMQAGAVDVLPILAGSVGLKAGQQWVRDLQFFERRTLFPTTDQPGFREISSRLADEVSARFEQQERSRPQARPPRRPNATRDSPNPSRPRPTRVPAAAHPAATTPNATSPEEAAIQHFLSDNEVQGWLSSTGQTPWMSVQASLARGLESADADDCSNRAYQLVTKAMDRQAGPGNWTTEKRAKKGDPSKTTTWIVIGKANQSQGAASRKTGVLSRLFGK